MRSGARALLVATLTAILAPSAGGAESGEQVLFRDGFAGGLEPGWSWRRDRGADHRVEPGVLHMRSRPGGLWRAENDLENVVSRPLPARRGDTLAVEVRVTSRPSAPYENAGIVLYFDDDHYVALVKELMGGELVVALSREEGGAGDVPHRVAYDAAHAWLRMEVSARGVASFYRASREESWRALGECSLPADGDAEVRIALLASYGHAEVEHWVQYRDFRILRLR